MIDMLKRALKNSEESLKKLDGVKKPEDLKDFDEKWLSQILESVFMHKKAQIEVTNIPKLAYFVKHPFADERDFVDEVIALLKIHLQGLFGVRQVLKKWVFTQPQDPKSGSKKGTIPNLQKTITLVEDEETIVGYANDFYKTDSEEDD